MFGRPGTVPWVARSLLRDRLRLAISIGGLAFAVVLVLLLRGIMDGTVERSTSYVDQVGADVFIANAGVTNMALASSTLPADVATELGRLDGVEAATGIIRLNIIAVSGDTSRPAELIAYDRNAALGGPWQVSSGTMPRSVDEVVIDSVLAGELGLDIGDTVEVAAREFTVAGMSTGTAAIAGKLLFMDLSAAQDLLRMPGLVSFVLLRLHPGVDATAFADALAAREDSLEALTRDQLSTNDRELLGSLFIQPVNVMSTVGFLVGLAIVGLTMYTTTAERIRDFGVLKAIGAPNSFLFTSVIAQAATLGVLGFTLGLLGTLAAGPVVERFVPDIGVTVHSLPAVQTFAAILLMSLFSALVPVARIARVDPLIVFKR